MDWLKKVAGFAPDIVAAITTGGGSLPATALKLVSKALTGKESDDVAEVQKAVEAASPDDLLRLKEANNSFVIRQMEIAADLEKSGDNERTARHTVDMQSDSWLSKNVRPFILVFLTIAVVFLAYLTTFILGTNEILAEWIDLFKLLLLSVYGFYFTSRGIEKVKSINKK